MKVRFYLDIYGALEDNSYLSAYSSPGPKYKDCKRVAFDVVLPDFNMPDVVLPTVDGTIVEEDN